MKKYAIIGFGGLGKTHFLNLINIDKKRGDTQLVAICDQNLENISKSITINLGTVNLENVDFSKYRLYSDYKEMLEREELDFVIITLPSFLHCEVGTYCLEHGVHVFTEKPMAITLEECEKLIGSARKNDKRLMVGQCLRFTPQYKLLKELVETEKYGKAIKAEFVRKSALPKWSAGGWLLDEKRSGGCIVDMHVHDVDIMVWLFGAPMEINVVSTHNAAPFESTYSIYKCDSTSVSIITDWNLPASFEFKTGYSVTFENAFVECIGETVKVYTDSGCEEVELKENTNYYDELYEFIECIAEDKEFRTADISSVHETMKVIFAEKAIIEKKKGN